MDVNTIIPQEDKSGGAFKQMLLKAAAESGSNSCTRVTHRDGRMSASRKCRMLYALYMLIRFKIVAESKIHSLKFLTV